VVIFIYINFVVKKHDVSGYIAMLMDMASLSALKGLLRDFIHRVTGHRTPDGDARA
jgi:chemotaxis protein CheC